LCPGDDDRIKRSQPVGDWRKAWAKACEKAGRPDALFHDLRRSGIRDLVRAGVPQSVVMAISGHRTISTFLRYDIASEEDKRSALEQARTYRETRKTAANVVPISVTSR
jgi:integrase